MKFNVSGVDDTKDHALIELVNDGCRVDNVPVDWEGLTYPALAGGQCIIARRDDGTPMGFVFFLSAQMPSPPGGGCCGGVVAPTPSPPTPLTYPCNSPLGTRALQPFSPGVPRPPTGGPHFYVRIKNQESRIKKRHRRTALAGVAPQRFGIRDGVQTSGAGSPHGRAHFSRAAGGRIARNPNRG